MKTQTEWPKKCDKANELNSAIPLQDPCGIDLPGHSPPDFVTFSALSVFREFEPYVQQNPNRFFTLEAAPDIPDSKDCSTINMKICNVNNTLYYSDYPPKGSTLGDIEWRQ